ncbi:MAG: SDR family NAD(P)-dependent oxidoreductase [Chryseobacterium sp.]|nr:SDR family NAD(P)-dependent oxidoreductase [Chryseobacterium sp.]
MGRTFITGSADGLGMMAAKLLIQQGHQVVLHARNQDRAKEALQANHKAETVLVGNLASISETIDLAKEVNKLGRFDAVIHNAAVGYREPRKIMTVDPRDFMKFSTEAIGKERFISIDKVENNSMDIYGKFHSDTWGDFKTYFKFRIDEDGKFDRLQIGQAEY